MASSMSGVTNGRVAPVDATRPAWVVVVATSGSKSAAAATFTKYRMLSRQTYHPRFARRRVRWPGALLVYLELKRINPDSVCARRAELAKRLAEIDLTNAEASTYSGYHSAIISHVNQVVTMLDNLEAKEEERVWLKRQQDGELDESRLPEGLTGESAIYKRRGQEKREFFVYLISRPLQIVAYSSRSAELGAPQLKPKRIRFVFDLSASMFRNAYNGGLTRSLECGASSHNVSAPAVTHLFSSWLSRSRPHPRSVQLDLAQGEVPCGHLRSQR